MIMAVMCDWNYEKVTGEIRYVMHDLIKRKLWVKSGM